MTAPAPGSVRPLKRTARDTRGKLLLLADDIGRVYGDGAREMTALLREVDTRLQQVVALLDDDSGTYTPEQVAARKEARVEERRREAAYQHELRCQQEEFDMHMGDGSFGRGF